MTKLVITHSTFLSFSPPLSFPFFTLPSFSHKTLPGADSSKDPVGLCSTSLHLPHGHPLLPEGRGRRIGATSCHHTLFSPLFLLSFLSSFLPPPPPHLFSLLLPHFLALPSLLYFPLFSLHSSPSLILPSSLPLLPLHHSTSSSLPPLTPSFRLCCQDDVIEVYLDYGDVHIPDSLQLPSLPGEVLEPVQWALSRVLDPGTGHRDSVFGRPLPNKPKSLELQVC